VLCALCSVLLIFGCAKNQDPSTVIMLIESSPTNLDPRIGVDAQAEHIDSLLFDALVRRDEHFGLQPFLATRWETPDPQTWVFHLRTDARFHDGRPLTSRDVKFTIDSILNGTVISVKAGSFTTLDHIDAPDPATVVFHLKKPDPALPFNLCDGAWEEDRPGIEVHILHPHAVEFAGVAHSGIAHDHDDVLERLCGHH